MSELMLPPASITPRARTARDTVLRGVVSGLAHVHVYAIATAVAPANISATASATVSAGARDA